MSVIFHPDLPLPGPAGGSVRPTLSDVASGAHSSPPRGGMTGPIYCSKAGSADGGLSKPLLVYLSLAAGAPLILSIHAVNRHASVSVGGRSGRPAELAPRVAQESPRMMAPAAQSQSQGKGFGTRTAARAASRARQDSSAARCAPDEGELKESKRLFLKGLMDTPGEPPEAHHQGRRSRSPPQTSWLPLTLTVPDNFTFLSEDAIVLSTDCGDVVLSFERPEALVAFASFVEASRSAVCAEEFAGAVAFEDSQVRAAPMPIAHRTSPRRLGPLLSASPARLWSQGALGSPRTYGGYAHDRDARLVASPRSQLLSPGGRLPEEVQSIAAIVSASPADRRDAHWHIQAGYDVARESYVHFREQRKKEVTRLFEERDRRREDFLRRRHMLRDDVIVPTGQPPERGADEGGLPVEEQQRSEAWSAFASIADTIGRKWERNTTTVEALLGGPEREGREESVLGTRLRYASLGSAHAPHPHPISALPMQVTMVEDEDHASPMAAVLRELRAPSITSHYSTYSAHTAPLFRDEPPAADGHAHEDPLTAAMAAEARLLASVSLQPVPPPPPLPTEKEDTVAPTVPTTAPQRGDHRREAADKADGTPKPLGGPSVEKVTPPSTNQLPDGWKEHTDPKSGRTYFSNAAQKKTVWNRTDIPDNTGTGKPSPAPTSPAAAKAAAVLPQGWKEMSDPKSGRTYFFNAATKVTSWTRPTDASDPPKSTPVSAVASLPDGWKELTDPKSGRTYFSNAAQKKTVWNRADIPDGTGPAKPSPAPASPEASPKAAAALPQGWKEMSDPKSGRKYFFNAATKVTSWTRPT